MRLDDDTTNAEAAAIIRAWHRQPPISAFSWPSDGTGYQQHCRYAMWFNRWRDGKITATRDEFDARYLAMLESGLLPEVGSDPEWLADFRRCNPAYPMEEV